jgi:site-specific DNA-adenine methylase
MWSYYGSKSKIAHLYPKPKFDKIIEPFAGSARYSLLHWDHDITLVDKYEVIVRIWRWLQQCSPQDILSLPSFKEGDRISREMFDCEEQFWLMGFMVNEGVGTPKTKVSWMAAKEYSFGNGIEMDKRKIASQLYKIKKWNIVHSSYECLGNIEATWYIDPPYQYGGHSYKESNKKLDFHSLAEWCQERKGQVIVCENTKADWLPFRPIRMISGTRNTNTTEAIWSNLPTDYDVEQLNIFNLLKE